MSSKDYWINLFQQLGALWLHDNNPQRPHALLTSGNHSGGFFNAGKVVFDHPQIAQFACQDLAVQFLIKNSEGLPTVIAGSAMGAITIARDFAAFLNVRMVFTEPEGEGAAKQMVLNKRFALQSTEVVLPVEDVMTTGGTTLKTIQTLENTGAKVLPVVCVLVNRSGQEKLGNRQIVSLINRPMPIWQPQDCPLCQKGSKAIRPKGNWDKLTADYS